MVWGKIRQALGISRVSYWNSGDYRKHPPQRRALLVGINNYESKNLANLKGCVSDAASMARVLSTHQSNSVSPAIKNGNYECELLIDSSGGSIKANLLLQKWKDLFDDDNKKFRGHAIFYFSGHGTVDETGGYLVMSDSDPKAQKHGFKMDDIVGLANNYIHIPGERDGAKSIVIIIDACKSGNAGDLAYGEGYTSLRQGVSILSASLPRQDAFENAGGGVFTQLVISALEGGAANILGDVSLASIYGYAEAAMGPYMQRPMYKTVSSNWESLRQCIPAVELDDLLALPEHFPTPEHQYPFDKSYEAEFKEFAKTEHVKIFLLFKRYQVAGLLEPVKELMPGEDKENNLYHAAEYSVPIRLTPLGQFYWRLVKSRAIHKRN